MSSEPIDPVEAALVAGMHALGAGGPGMTWPGTAESLLGTFDDQCTSRHLDLVARRLRAKGHGYYTIGSSGHEANAFVAAALRPTDPALLHYRSGGFYCARARQRPGIDPVRDVLGGMLASVDEPIAGGRHKVWGRRELAVIPQTSTIASHLPRAVGLALTIGRAPKLAAPLTVPTDSVVVCSFGDASANHSTALGAINSASLCAYQRLPLPLLFVCEDNGIGISVRTPSGWIEANFAHRPQLRYDQADSTHPEELAPLVEEMAGWVRSSRRPAFLHLKCVRFGGHAGTDVESGYRSAEEIRSDYARDPILATAAAAVRSGAATPAELVERYQAIGRRVAAVAAEMVGCRQLGSAEEVAEPLAPRRADAVAIAVGASVAPPDQRAAWFGRALPEEEGPLTLAQAINRTLADALVASDDMMLFGEDVAAKGGVYGVTRGLLKRGGGARVFDTMLDEQSILGMALGASLVGMVPVPEIQYLAYLHHALDQIRGEAATMQFFSKGQYRNGMVVRVASFGYQKGFGGHFHNDSSLAALRDIPGLVVAAPSRAGDAAAMLRTLIAAARVDGTVSVFCEPIALYHSADLLDPGDDEWTDHYAPPSRWVSTHVPIGSANLIGMGTDLLIVTFANGVHLSMRALRRLAEEGVSASILDLRWLSPLPVADLLSAANEIGKVLVVDETRHSGGVGEAVIAALVEGGFAGPIHRVASADSFVPLGDAAFSVLVSEDQIVEAAFDLARR